MGNLALPDYATGVSDYNAGLSGLTGEIGPVPRKGLATIFFPKIDWQISAKNHATFEVNRTRWSSPAGIQTQASNTFATNSFGSDYVKDTWGVAKLYTSISQTLTNEVRFQYGRDFEFEFPQSPTAYEQANFVNPPGYTKMASTWASPRSSLVPLSPMSAALSTPTPSHGLTANTASSLA